MNAPVPSLDALAERARCARICRLLAEAAKSAPGAAADPDSTGFVRGWIAATEECVKHIEHDGMTEPATGRANFT